VAMVALAQTTEHREVVEANAEAGLAPHGQQFHFFTLHKQHTPASREKMLTHFGHLR
jgi:hypothetical protein